MYKIIVTVRYIVNNTKNIVHDERTLTLKLICVTIYVTRMSLEIRKQKHSNQIFVLTKREELY